jgi:hypothetical protein
MQIRPAILTLHESLADSIYVLIFATEVIMSMTDHPSNMRSMP